MSQLQSDEKYNKYVHEKGTLMKKIATIVGVFVALAFIVSYKYHQPTSITKDSNEMYVEFDVITKDGKEIGVIEDNGNRIEFSIPKDQYKSMLELSKDGNPLLDYKLRHI